METEVRYRSYPEAVALHILLMRREGEIHYGIFSRELIQSALARPQQAAAYEGADLLRQAASLCYGLIKNHPWLGGNKRTATFLTMTFLRSNGVRIAAATEEYVDMVLAVEADRWGVNEIETWLRQHAAPVGTPS